MKMDGVIITGITCNSNKVKDGFAFVAIKGLIEDGNNHIDSAIKNGASIVYTEENITNKNIPVIKVINAREKLTELLNKYYDYPSEKFKLIGVTGTNGKTTTANIIYHILKKAGLNIGIIGTLGITVGERYIDSSLTTPEPELLFNVLNEMVKSKVDAVIMEVSSHGIKQKRIFGLDFDIAVHTNIEYDHIDFHKTKEDYIKTKKLLFDSLKKNGISIVNIDDKEGIKLIENNSNAIIVTYGLNSKASITASSLKLSDNISFNLCIQRGMTALNNLEIEPMEIPIAMKLMGRHNIYNSLAAISSALCFGIQPNEIANSLCAFKGVDRRLDVIYDEEYLVVDDFCHNPAGYEAVFEAIQTLNFNRLIVVNSIRGNRGTEINKRNAEVIGSWSSTIKKLEVILSASKDVTCIEDDVSEYEMFAYKDVLDRLDTKYLFFKTLEESIKEALNIVQKNDLILLLGAQGMNKGKEILYNISQEKRVSSR